MANTEVKGRVVIAGTNTGIQEPFAVVHADNLALFDAESVMDTERAALKRRDALIVSNPALRNTLQVVPVFEMSA